MSQATDNTAPGAESQLVVASQVYPTRLPIVPLPGRPIFPKVVAPLALDSPGLIALARDVQESGSNLIGLVLRREEQSNGNSDGKPAEVFPVGVIAQILKSGAAAGTGQPMLLVGGLDRFRIQRILEREPYLIADVQYLYAPRLDPSDEVKAFGLAVINTIKDLVQLSPLFKDELNLLATQGKFEDPNQLADLAAFLTSAEGTALQDILETLDVRERMEKVLGLLKKELDISKLQARIRQQIEERISKQQRELLLREQLKAIKKELGLERDDKEAEIERYLERLQTRSPTVEAKERIDDEVDKLRAIEPSSPEYNLTRNYVDWLTALPWGVESDDATDLAAVRRALDEDHYGLTDVKERIVEFVAAGILRGNFSGSVICLVGPPGVGKTSVGRSIATSIGRQFYRFSLGGMRDEAEIKGHRRTYIGAMPGKFLQALRVCKTQNPVIMLDEIDKVGASFRGDPAAALLEALDPEQNSDFLDHYLDVRFDLSNVLFVCTANQLDTIPPALLDRMEVIHLAGYILEEKVQIALKYIVPRQRKELGLKRNQFTITKAALRELIDGYAREAGVRSLEKQIKKIARKSAVKLLEGKSKKKISIDPGQVHALLGKRIYPSGGAYEKPRPGVILGLAWTSHGGDTLFVEAINIPSPRPGLKQTGQLGKVMIESSEIAYTVVRSACAPFEECRRFFEENQIHLHVPAGATPKDGPSAGITMACALYTLARNRPIRAGFAMTGELDLRGDVLPVGGIREKIIAAKRAKVRHVILPKDNEGDYERLLDYVKSGLTPHFVATFDEVIALAIADSPAKSRKR